MRTPDYVVFASGGNDSVALVQYAHEVGHKGVAVAYSNTGWAAQWWPERMMRFQSWVESLGFSYHEIASEGMEALAIRKQGWPANKPKFCTYELKIKPAMAWLELIDPYKTAVCMVGIRRCAEDKLLHAETKPAYLQHGVIIGCHAGNNNILVKWDGEKGVEQMYGSRQFLNLTPAQQKTYTELMKRQEALQDYIMRFETAHVFSGHDAVDKAVKEDIVKATSKRVTSKRGSVGGAK